MKLHCLCILPFAFLFFITPGVQADEIRPAYLETDNRSGISDSLCYWHIGYVLGF